MHLPVPDSSEVEETPKPKRETSSLKQFQLGALSHRRGIAEGFREHSNSKNMHLADLD